MGSLPTIQHVANHPTLIVQQVLTTMCWMGGPLGGQGTQSLGESETREKNPLNHELLVTRYSLALLLERNS